jgi:hypothetical protein
MKWISVEDKLPEELFYTVLVHCKHPFSGGLTMAAHHEGNAGWHIHESQESNFCDYVTHWMSLPEPPK